VCWQFDSAPAHLTSWRPTSCYGAYFFILQAHDYYYTAFAPDLDQQLQKQIWLFLLPNSSNHLLLSDKAYAYVIIKSQFLGSRSFTTYLDKVVNYNLIK